MTFNLSLNIPKATTQQIFTGKGTMKGTVIELTSKGRSWMKKSMTFWGNSTLNNTPTQVNN